MQPPLIYEQRYRTLAQHFEGLVDRTCHRPSHYLAVCDCEFPLPPEAERLDRLLTCVGGGEFDNNYTVSAWRCRIFPDDPWSGAPEAWQALTVALTAALESATATKAGIVALDAGDFSTLDKAESAVREQAESSSYTQRQHDLEDGKYMTPGQI